MKARRPLFIVLILLVAFLQSPLAIIPHAKCAEGDYTDEHWDTSGQSGDPYGIATDGSNIWVVDRDHDEVYKYDMDGIYTTEHWDISGQFGTPFEMTTDGINIWIVDEPAAEVYKYEGPPSYSGDWQISQSSDDCIKYDATWSTVTPLGPYWHSASANTVASGLRWQNITIPRGVSIESAYIKWCAWSTVGGVAASPIVIIRGEDIDSSLTFSTVADFDNRDRTDASAEYTIPALVAAEWYYTTDLSTIIQEIIDRDGWSSGNNLTLFTGPKSQTTSSKYGRSYDLSDGSFSPFLIITWIIIIEPPSDPDLLFGAGFNASSPYVELHWNHSLVDVLFFEVQNSTDKVTWAYLGSNTTAEYTDLQVVNGTERYYRVRACKFTDGNWYNSSWSDIDFETVYFVMPVGVGNGDGAELRPEGWVLTIMIAAIGVPLIILGTRRRRK